MIGNLLDVLGLTLNPTLETELAQMDLTALERLRERLKRERRWEDG